MAEVVAKQVAAGIDVVSDGEMSKPSYATYCTDAFSRFTRAVECAMLGLRLRQYV